MEAAIRKMFDENFQRLRAESGHSLSPEVKNLAWQQVVLYWRRLRDIAESITDTEVRLNLPCQKTPKGRAFSIEGVVDIVREADRTTMYDIKTHDLNFVKENLPFYEKQLNVYAYIWQHLRGVYGVGWGWIILAEVVNAQQGLGYLIFISDRRSHTASIFAIIIVIVVIAVACDQLWKLGGQLLFPYLRKE